MITRLAKMRTSMLVSLTSFAVLMGLVVPASLAAADGKPGEPKSGVLGTVVDSETGKPLPFASVHLIPRNPWPETPEGGYGTLSKADGSFRVAGLPGDYTVKVTYLGYQAVEVSDVVVQADAFLTLNLSLTPSAIKLETVEVTAKEVKAGDAALLAKQKKSAAVSDGVSSEQIKRTTDSNAAEALTRVTGTSVVGGRFVYVRGLGERYSQTQVNGTTIGSPEPNKRVVPLDLFPASLLDNVVIQKTYTPDLPGEFAGGVVDVNTRDFPGQKVWSFTFAPGYNAETTGQPFMSYRGGGDFLGFSGSERDLPDMVQQLAKDQPIRPRGLTSTRGFSPDTIEAMGESFNRVWIPEENRARMTLDFAGSYGDEFELFGQPLGFIAGVSLDNTLNSLEYESNTYESRDVDGHLTPRTDYDATSSTAGTLWGALLNTSYRLGASNTLHLRSMYNRSAEDEVRYYEGDNTDRGRPLRDNRFRYIERGIFTGSAGMDHHIEPLMGSDIEWSINYSQSERNEPDRREYVYEMLTSIDDPDGEGYGAEPETTQVWELTKRDASSSFTRLYSYMDDIERTYEASWALPFKQWNGLPASLKAGYLMKDKNRDLELRRFTFKQPTGTAIDLSQGPDSLLTDEHIGGVPESFRLEELTRGGDSYSASQELNAKYLMVDIPVISKVRLVTGVRWEESNQRVITLSPFGPPDAEPTIAGLHETDAMPSVNVTYTPVADLNIRYGYSSTVSRPDLRELTPFGVTDFVSGYEEQGNPDLKRALIRNHDVRVEFYPGVNELLAVSAFHKKFTDPIEKSIQGGAQPVLIPINGEGGYLYGVELEARVGLGRAGSSLQPFGFGGNLTLVKSETELNTLGVETSPRRPLEGQSPYVTNLGLYYAAPSGRTSASLLYNVFGKRLSGVGAYGLPDIYEMSHQSLDATLTYGVRGGLMKLGLENLLNDEVRFEQDGAVTYRAKEGVSVSLALSYGTR